MTKSNLIKGRQLSLLVTLGIAAIDLLTCAFVSSVVLFVMFLVPAASGGTTVVGDPNDILMLDWTYTTDPKGPSRPVIGLRLGHGGPPVPVRSDMPESEIDDACRHLSDEHDAKSHCSMSQAVDGSRSEGYFLITHPAKSQWTAEIAFADTEDDANSGNYAPLQITILVIGKQVVDLKGIPLILGDVPASLDTLSTSRAGELKSSLDLR